MTWFYDKKNYHILYHRLLKSTFCLAHNLLYKQIYCQFIVLFFSDKWMYAIRLHTNFCARQQHPSYTDYIMIGLEGGGLCTRYVNYVNEPCNFCVVLCTAV